jgi:hypothetical protein
VGHDDDFVVRKRIGPERTQAATEKKRPEMRCNNNAEIRVFHDRDGQVVGATVFLQRRFHSEYDGTPRSPQIV